MEAMKTKLAHAAALAVLAATLPVAAQPASGRLRMLADLEFLCSPALEGRASLSRGADAAAWFLASEFRKAGLEPANGTSYLQRFDLVPVSLDRGRSAVVVRRGARKEPFAPVAVFFSDPTRPIDLDLDVVFAGFGITAPELGYDDYAGLDVRGKAVLIFDHEPREDDPASIFHGTGFTLHANVWTKTRNAERHGAVAVLLATEPVNTHRRVPPAPGRASAPPQALAPSALGIPRFTVPPEALDALLAGTGRTPADWQRSIDEAGRPRSQALDGVRVSLRAANAVTDAAPSWNVAGLLPGRDPARRGETILVTSHYDHLGVRDGRLYPGANDNASGTVAMLEVARRLAADPPARSVLFVSFGSEEQLMLGSYHYVAHPLRPLETTRAVLNLDMVGRNEAPTPESEGAYEVTAGRADQLNLVGAIYSPDLRAVLDREAARAGMTLSDKFDRDSSSRALFRCDHLPFLQHEVPAVWLFGGFHPGYHEPVDTIDRLDFDKLENVVRLAAGAARALGDADRVPAMKEEE